MRLAGWNEPDPAEVFHPTNDAEWAVALDRYLGSLNDLPLWRCVAVARALGASTLVVETRYLDLDYRSEFSAYYSRQFADIPDSAHRLHFFRRRLTAGSLWRLAGKAEYLGYAVIRPSRTGLVSRSLLPPPPDLADAVRVSVVERVNFFGQMLESRGMPFSQQNAQLGACAHAAAWMCHFTAHLRGDTVRRAKADFALRADASLHPGRALPTGGLTVDQLSELFRTFELPAIFYRGGELPSLSSIGNRPIRPPRHPMFPLEPGTVGSSRLPADISTRVIPSWWEPPTMRSCYAATVGLTMFRLAGSSLSDMTISEGHIYGSATY